MSNQFTPDFDSDDDRTPGAAGTLSSNGQWIFGSVFAGMLLVGFSFGVWAGVSKTKPVEKPPEVAEVKKDEKPVPVVTPPVLKPKDNTPPVVTPPVVTPPVVTPPVVEPKPKEKEPDPKPKVEIKAVAYKEVSDLFRQYCNNCHGAIGKPKGGADLRTFAAIMKGGENGAMVKPGDPDKSSLYLSIKMGTMPPDGKPGPNEKELKLIHDWIASGAKERRRTIRGRRGVPTNGTPRRPGHSPNT